MERPQLERRLSHIYYSRANLMQDRKYNKSKN